MSDIRLADVSITIKMRPDNGKKLTKNCKFELFKASQFASAIDPKNPKKFSPVPPGNPKERKKFLASHYRVKENGQWIRDEAKYTLFELKEIVLRFAE